MIYPDAESVAKKFGRMSHIVRHTPLATAGYPHVVRRASPTCLPFACAFLALQVSTRSTVRLFVVSSCVSLAFSCQVMV